MPVPGDLYKEMYFNVQRLYAGDEQVCFISMAPHPAEPVTSALNSYLAFAHLKPEDAHAAPARLVIVIIW
jgi:hypothetical protein